ncbi:MAG: ABC transporter permease, partial [Thiobacillus sp.]|nr:ABC transporter permease [Thiobacillus sp.]
MLRKSIENLGNRTIQGVWRIGFAARFFVAVLLHSGTAFRRFGLTIREMYFTG